MAINKVVMAALKAISYAELDLKKNYKLERSVQNILHPSLKMLYHMEDFEIHLTDHNVPIRVFSPSKLVNDEVFLFFHGGGFVTGNVDNYAGTCSALSENTGRRVVSVDYRLAPEYPYPCAAEECYQVAKILEEKTEKMILIGDSAGGNLSAVVSLMARDRGEFSVDRQILIYPSTYNEHNEKSPFPSIRENGKDYLLTSKKLCDYLELYMPDKKEWFHPYFAPLLAEDLSRQPETLIITAELDPLRDEGEEYGNRLREAGNNVKMFRFPDAIHGFFSLPSRFEQVTKSHELILKFLEPNHTGGGLCEV